MTEQNIQAETEVTDVQIPSEQELYEQTELTKAKIIEVLKGVPTHTGIPALLDLALGTIASFEDVAQKENAFAFATHTLFATIMQSGLDVNSTVQPVLVDFITAIDAAMPETTEEAIA